MKILSVEMQGFGPFKDAQAVDFSAFDESGIFLIGGRTGAGKSTILDAICFALYDKVPRYDRYSGVMPLRSDHCETDDVTRVTLTFEANNVTYRIVRSPKFDRPKVRRTGTTRVPARAELAILRSDGDWDVVETNRVEVDSRILEVVTLEADQFLQVILLAQNRFQEFLEAESNARQGLLRTLFGTQRFEDYSQELAARAKALGEQLKSVEGGTARTVDEIASTVDVEPPVELEDRLVWARSCVTDAIGALELARASETQAAAAARVASEALTDAQMKAERQARRREAEVRLAGLVARSEEHAEDKRRRDAADRGAAVKQRLEDADAAARALEQAQEHEASAHDAAGELPEVALGDAVAEIGQSIGALARALETETKLGDLQRAAAQAAAQLEEHDQSSANIVVQRAASGARSTVLDNEQMRADTVAKEFSAAAGLIATTEQAYAAALRAAELEPEVEKLKQAELRAADARTETSGQVGRLLRLQIAGRAALLAADLIDGDPCPVCGAIEHPHPAQSTDETVSDEQLDAAREAAEQAADAANAASRERSEAERDIAEQRGAAGGRDAETLANELGEAQATLAEAEQAEARLEEIRLERKQIAETLDKLAEAERTAAGRRTELAEQRTLAADKLMQANELLIRSREGYETVAARVTALKERRGALEVLIAAGNALASAAAAERVAEDALHARLTEYGFTDRAAAEAVILPDAELQALRAVIRTYEDGLTETEGVLKDPYLQDLPDEPVDVAGATGRANDAAQAQKQSTELRVACDATAKRVVELTDRLEDELKQSAEQEEELNILGGLAAAVKGDPPNQPGVPLESFVLAAELEEIVVAANGRLQRMSQGRYAIEHSDARIRGGKRTGLELVVYDAYTGAARSPRSLSGGEKFLASLALALGLAEIVTGRAGGIQLDTLFIDEGFGSLDDETLGIAMQTLDSLRQGGRSVGVISHVEAMKDQIPAKLLVEVADGGWSVIRQDP